MKTPVIIAIAVITLFSVLAGGVYFFTKTPPFPQTAQTIPMPQTVIPEPTAPQENPTPVTLSHKNIVEVDYQNGIFTPNPLTVKVGTTVNFVNQGSGDMWVGSDPHPAHTDLPGFDQLGNGRTYAYTFVKIGSWGYHDHLNPASKGRVIVTP